VRPDIRVVTNKQELNQAAAAEIERRTGEAVRAKGGFTIALAGGSTPKSVYSLLAEPATAKRLPWDKMYFFFGDERHVPPDHQDSNYRMAEESLFCKVPVTQDHLFRVPAENPDAGQAAESYQRTLRNFFRLQPGEFPRFDLILLGMGPDGHTASLFPHTAALHENNRLVVANWVEKFNTHRITFTVPVINNASAVMFMISGAEKRPALSAVLTSDASPEEFPSKLVRPENGELIWLIEADACPPGLERQQKPA
jgi:6-phosphogluconolactonase